MSTCPECRNRYPARPRRHRYAEKAAEELAELKEKRAQILNSWTVLSRKYWNFRDCVSLLPQHKNAKVMITRMFAELGFLKILGNLLKKIMLNAISYVILCFHPILILTLKFHSMRLLHLQLWLLSLEPLRVKCKLWSLTPWLRFTFTFYKI